MNGIPSCANDWLLNGVLREEWGRDDVLVGTDCGAINNMIWANRYASNGVDASAKAINAGVDEELVIPFYFSVYTLGG